MFDENQIKGNINTIQEQLLFNIDKKLENIININKELADIDDILHDLKDILERDDEGVKLSRKVSKTK